MLTLSGGQVECLWTRCCRSRRASCRRIWLAWTECSQIRCCSSRSRPSGAERAWSWPAVDLDGKLRAADGDQAAHGLGLRNARAEVSDSLHLRRFCLIAIDQRVPRSRRSESSPPAGSRGRGRDHQGGDLKGAARDTFPCAGREDRLDGRGGGHPLPSDAMLALQGVRVLAREGRKVTRMIRQETVRVRIVRVQLAGCPCISKTLARRTGQAKAE